MINLKKRDQYVLLDSRLSYCKARYEETKNPLYIWEAIYHSRKDDRPIKAWIRKYLVEVSENILKIERPKRKTDVSIKEALKIKSGRQFSEYENIRKIVEVHDYIHAIYHKPYIKIEPHDFDKNKKKEYGAFEKAAKFFGISLELAKKYYYEEEQWKEKIIKEEK
jgi:hypothetical protein